MATRLLKSISNTLFLSVILLLCCCINTLHAQQKAAIPVVHLREQTLYPLPNAQQWLDSFRSKTVSEPAQVLMVFNSLPADQQKADLREQGIYLKDYLSDQTFTALIQPGRQMVQLGAIPLFSIISMQPAWKTGVFPEPVSGNKQMDIIVSCYPEIRSEDLQHQLKTVGGQLITSPLSDLHFYEVTIPADKILRLAAWYGIRTIGPAARDQPLNFESNGATKNNIAQLATAFGGYGLLGDSITIGVGDNGPGVNHVDLRDRIVNYNPVPYTNHGMHINGIVGGAGTMNPKAQGFAPHAILLDHLYNLVWARTGTMVRDHNMTVTNNSYAAIVGNCAYEGVYDAYSQALDSLTLQYPNVLHVFASGNDGNLNCTPYPVGFGTVTGGYQPAKNVLVVGQTDKRYLIGNGSSKGPVKDGRLKPEITAIGSDVLSTRGNDIYLYSGGTSMASPQVAGAAALLQQRYKQLNGNALPPSDLIKILLMNGTMDLGNPGPDYSFGFGMMDVMRSLQMLDSNRFFRSSITNGGVQTQTITVPPNTGQLKVMIYWHEAPASVLAARQLINDLDLEVLTPSGTTVLPLVLDPTPANITNNAVNGTDRLNNVEQVTINNPAAGNYTIRVKGYAVASGPQSYVIAYDPVPVGVRLSYPTTGATVQSNDSVRIYWDASPDAGTFTLEFSADNGAAWTTIVNNLPAERRHYVWYPTGINSELCRMRLTRNGTSQIYTTGIFVTNEQPDIRLNAVQCPGYMNINWSPVPHATAYRILRKKGPFLQPETVVTDTTFSLKGLTPDSVYYMAVQPLINGTAGFRSLGISRKADNGSCAGNISDGDLMVEKLVTPVSGRLLTSTQLGNAVSLGIRIRNLDDVPATSYRISYRLNSGAWQTQVISTPIPANSAQLVTIPAALNLSAAGTYDLKIAVTNLALTDHVTANDTLSKTIRQLANNPVNLTAGVTEDFESVAPYTVFRDSLGITPDEHWDFHNNNDTGRLRTFVNSDITISGNRSASMDLVQYLQVPAANFLNGTFNAAAYTTATHEVRLDFDYKLHGIPHYPDSNKVWVRGSDTQPWLPLSAYDFNALPGIVQHNIGLSVTDALVTGGQNFSTSTQIRFGQQDTSVIALNDYGCGLTLDNIKLFTVQNDIVMDSILVPIGAVCNLTTTPVRIVLHNGVSQTLTNIRVSYSLDNGPVNTETIASLAGKASLTYTFIQPLTITTSGTHNIKVWASVTGDTYHNNDTLDETIHNQPLISNYPYLENFEANDGFWYTEGRNSSWQYGTPNTNSVRNAASGSNVWKTNLTGYYNDNELSYLYSPCFNLSGLTSPMLSFSTVLDIENCGGTLCDAGWLEYSTDNGISWAKLGAYNEGYSWYTDSARRIWNEQGNTRWHVSSIPLPVTAGTMRLRFVLSTDPGTGANGITLDDVHIFNKEYPIYDGPTAGPLTQSVSGLSFINFLSGSKMVAQIKPDGQNLGSTDIHVYIHPSIDTASRQYYLQRSFTVSSTLQPADSVTARLYVLDAEVQSLINATGCVLCTKPKDVYRLGISKYDDSVLSNENGTLSDNVNGVWTFFPKNRIKWVPYDNGYYAEVRLPSFSELWFNDGGPGGNLSLPNYTLGKNELVAVYPNPNTEGVLNIIWTTALQKHIEVSLTDIVGKKVYGATLAATNGRNSTVLNTGQLPGGVYFLKCIIGNSQYVQKVVFK